MTSYWCEWAWLGGDAVSAGVVLEVEGPRLASVTTDRPAPPGAVRLAGVTLPGLVNGHSHAFHRALRGRTQGGEGSFWTWREQMYVVAERLDPDRYHRLARATFAEMALAGITTVGEFHYLHHGPDGQRYGEANAMGLALVAAAQAAGVRLTLIDTCYLHGGIGAGRDAELTAGQLRFSDGSVEAWAARVEALATQLAPNGPARVAPRCTASGRSPPRRIAEVGAVARANRWPLHAHVSEQPAENLACLAAYGHTPTQVLGDAGALGPDFTAVHAVHLTPADTAALGAGSVCVCPTTERDLADGVAPASDLASAGATLGLGTDSNAVIDLFEEARAVELDERLVTGRRGHHPASRLLGAATAGGARSLGWTDAGRLEAGWSADFVTVGLDSVRMAGTRPPDALGSLVFAAAAPDVRHVVVDGVDVVIDGRHTTIDVAAELAAAIEAVAP